MRRWSQLGGATRDSGFLLVARAGNDDDLPNIIFSGGLASLRYYCQPTMRKYNALIKSKQFAT